MTTPAVERAHWDAQATDQGVWAVAPSRWAESTTTIVERICGHMPDRGRILEIGCGVGRLTTRVAEALPDAWVVGSDVSPGMLAEAWSRPHPENVSWLHTDGRSLPVGPWDGIYSVVTFQHIPLEAQRSYIWQAREHLTPGGRLLVQVVEGVEDSDWNHHTNRREVEQWCDGLDARITGDTDFPTWLWIGAVKP